MIRNREVTRILFVCIVCLLVFSASSPAQFKGNSQVISDTAFYPDIAYGTKNAVLVWAKSTFGLFWIEKNGKALCFASLNQLGKIKGGVKTLYDNDLLEITTIDAVWNGSTFVVAFPRTQVINWSSVHTCHLASVSTTGKIKGKIKRIASADEVETLGLAWNGKYLGLAYWTDWVFKSEDNALFFQRLNKKLKAIGDPLKLMAREDMFDINVASNGKEFVVAWRCDFFGKVIYLQRLSKSGKALGKQIEINCPDEVESIRLIFNGSGYALIFTEGDDDVKFALLNKKLKIMYGPATINPKTGDEVYIPVFTFHNNSPAPGAPGGGEYWAFWKNYLDFSDTSFWGSYGIVGGKLDSGGEVIVSDKWLTKKGQDIDEIPAAVASNGQVVVLAYRKFVPNHHDDEEGELRILPMKK